MLKSNKLSLAKGLVQALSQKAYQERGELALIGFRGEDAKILKAPGKCSMMNSQWIDDIQGGGATPVGEGITVAEKLLMQYQWKFPALSVDCYLLSDCRFRALPAKPKGAANYTIVDFEESLVILAKGKQLAKQWQADYLHAMTFL